MENKESSNLFSKSWLRIVLIVVLFIGGLGVRLLDLTDLPNDFYMARQYGSLLIARGMYYANLPTAPEWQREFAIARVESTWFDRTTHYGKPDCPHLPGHW